MNRLHSILIIYCGFILSGCTKSPNKSFISIDNDLSDWSGLPLFFHGEEAIQKVKIADSEKYLYIYFQLRDSINIQSFPGSLELLIKPANSIDSLAFSMAFSRQDRPRANGYGAGSGLKISNWERWGSPYQAGILITPVSFSNTFEMRILKHFTIDSSSYTLPQEFQLTMKYGNEYGSFSTDLTYETTSSVNDLTVNKTAKKQNGSMRVLSWNVADQYFKENPQFYKQVFEDLQPDIILLDEVNTDVSPEQLQSLLSTEWNFVISNQGGRQKTVIGSTYHLEKIPEICNIIYPSKALNQFDQKYPDQSEQINIEQEANVASCGAWLQLRNQKILLTSLDLYSSGHYNSLNDDFRLLQSSLIANTIKEVNPDNQAIIIGGDFNLVGSHMTMKNLKNVGTLALLEASGRHLNDNVNYTWRQLGNGRWLPGQLDYILHSPTLQGHTSFTYKLEDHFTPEEVDKMSGHYPVILDFELSK